MPSNRKASDFRLRKHAEYQRVYKAARKKHGKLLAYFFAQRSLAPESDRTVPDGPRVGLTVPKALGKAVVRNRIKRRMRAAVRACLPLLSSPVDVILHPRRTVEDCPFAALEQEVASSFRSVQASQVREHARNEAPGSQNRSHDKKDARPGASDARPMSAR